MLFQIASLTDSRGEAPRIESGFTEPVMVFEVSIAYDCPFDPSKAIAYKALWAYRTVGQRFASRFIERFVLRTGRARFARPVCAGLEKNCRAILFGFSFSTLFWTFFNKSQLFQNFFKK